MAVRLEITASDFATSFRALLETKREASADVEATVRVIVGDVAARGEAAVKEYTRKFDHCDLDHAGLQVTTQEITAAVQRCSPAAIEAFGLYVPGGTAAYPSSVLMNAVPAKVAGVPRLVMAVPAPRGELNPLVLAAAKLAGVDEIFRIGGAQAIAALAYGTKTIAPV